MQEKKCNIIDPHWDEAIADAKRKLGEGKTYLARIKAAIKVFEKNKGDGVQWPSRKRTTKRIREQHSV